MIRLIYIMVLILTTTDLAAQRPELCDFGRYQRYHQSSISRSEMVIRQELDRKLGAQQFLHNPYLKIIPVVVHVIHSGGSENISDEQIQSQIKILNEDFRRMAGTNGFGLGVDAEIEFCLAKKDPQGRCTNGILRVNSLLSDHQTYQRNQLKQLSYWDNKRYLNMYVVKNINNGSGILGYASFPGGPPDEDGIVVRHNYFGSVGTAGGGLGRTTTHEIGHWFGLYHTFNGGCGVDTCSDGDFVCDTPPVANPNFGCTANVNSCTLDSSPDQVQNYLDYTDDNCKSVFTQGQKDRMHAALTSQRQEIWQQWNLDSTGCDSDFSNGPCPPIADFTTLTPVICISNPIKFYSRSQNNPVSFRWYFPGGNPMTSTLENPTVVYSSAGSFAVKLVVSGSKGSDSIEQLNYISVTIPPKGRTLPFYENFETGTFPPNGISLENNDNGVTWELDNVAVPYQGKGCARINNLINTNYGQSDALLLPNLDFTTISAVPYLYFKWAYAQSDINYSDELVVLGSKDCGTTWSQLYYRTKGQLATGPVQTTPYVPDVNTTWKSASVKLNGFSGSDNVLLKIVNVTDGGNSLYVDNIGVGLFPLEVADIVSNDVRMYPNPVTSLIRIEYGFADIKKVELISQLGETVQSETVGTGRTAILQLNDSIPAGVYFLRIFTDAKYYVKKVLVQR